MSDRYKWNFLNVSTLLCKMFLVDFGWGWGLFIFLVFSFLTLEIGGVGLGARIVGFFDSLS